jgi:hypothetical protein
MGCLWDGGMFTGPERGSALEAPRMAISGTPTASSAARQIEEGMIPRSKRMPR